MPPIIVALQWTPSSRRRHGGLAPRSVAVDPVDQRLVPLRAEKLKKNGKRKRGPTGLEIVTPPGGEHKLSA